MESKIGIWILFYVSFCIFWELHALHMQLFYVYMSLDARLIFIHLMFDYDYSYRVGSIVLFIVNGEH